MEGQYDQLFTALSKAQAQMTGGKATAKNPFLKNTYASIEDIWSEIRDPFSENGLLVTQLIKGQMPHCYVETILGHVSGQYITSQTPIIMAHDAKNAAQAFGSGVTYAKRYGMSAITGFSLSDKTDDDAEVAGEKKRVVTMSSAQLEELKVYLSVPGFLDEIRRRIGGLKVGDQPESFYREMKAYGEKLKAQTTQEEELAHAS